MTSRVERTGPLRILSESSLVHCPKALLGSEMTEPLDDRIARDSVELEADLMQGET